MIADPAQTQPIDLHGEAEPTPLYDAVAADLGPLHDPVDTDYVLIESMAVQALLEQATT